MAKKVLKMVIFNLCVFLLGFIIISNQCLGFNFLNLSLSPPKFGIAWGVTFFIAVVFIYVNYLHIYGILKHMRHAEKLVVKDAVLNDVDDALKKLTVAKRENSKLDVEISMVYVGAEEFQNKLDILKRLLANHGEKVSEWNWIVDFNSECEREILANIREVIDTSIVFDNENSKNTSLEPAKSKIRSSSERIVEILKKYDEFLDVVQKVLERKLRAHGNIVTDSLDATIQSVKNVYEIEDEQEKASQFQTGGKWQ